MPINSSTVAGQRSSERKSCMSLTLNQELEMIQLSKHGMSKAEIGWKLSLLCQFDAIAKENLKEIKSRYYSKQCIKESKITLLLTWRTF